MAKEEHAKSGVSLEFKLAVFGLIFILTILRVFEIVMRYDVAIVPVDVLLSIVLLLFGYLWIHEIRDKYKLKEYNKALIAANVKLENAEIDTIKALILTEEAKDPYVCGHSQRVSKIAVVLAEEMGLSEDRVKLVERASILHDIGKVAIPDAVLQKPAKLHDDEWKLMKNHPTKAVEILEPLEFLKLEKKIIEFHHERLDGKGYPKGAKAEEIPLEAQIISVADAFDAMNSTRPYRKEMSKEEILDELKRVIGTQLNQAVVDTLLMLLEKRPDLWEKEGSK